MSYEGCRAIKSKRLWAMAVAEKISVRQVPNKYLAKFTENPQSKGLN
jgi:hypothetical protein